jgi:Cu-processing system permease protein
MSRVLRALILHEFIDKARDRWVLISSAMFALLALSIASYGGNEGAANMVTAPSLVTLSALIVPLVALLLGHEAIVGERERHTLGLLLSLPIHRGEVILAKFFGRSMALAVSIGIGLGASSLVLAAGQRELVLNLLPATLLLGSSFLSLGILISVLADRVATAVSLAVVCWFVLVFFYDLGLLALMVATDGSISPELISWLVSLNPTGLYRTQMLIELVGNDTLQELGLTVSLPTAEIQALIWSGWIGGCLLIGTLVLHIKRSVVS